MVTFYTCGASTFVITPSAGIAGITYPTSGATLYLQYPRIIGTGSTNGAVVTLTESG